MRREEEWRKEAVSADDPRGKGEREWGDQEEKKNHFTVPTWRLVLFIVPLGDRHKMATSSCRSENNTISPLQSAF